MHLRDLDPFDLSNLSTSEERFAAGAVEAAGCERAFGAPSPGSLDKKGNFSFRPVEGWRAEKAERWRWVQEGARIAFAGTNIARCGHVAAKSREVYGMPVVRLGHVRGSKEVSAIDVYTCDNGSVCPYCGRAKARGYKEALTAILAELFTERHPMYFGTFTHAHTWADDLRDLLDGFQDRFAAIISPSGRGAKARREWLRSMGCRDGFWSGECNISDRNGYHVHRHFILVFEPGTPEETCAAVWRWMRAEWVRLCKADGYEARECAQKIRAVNDAEGIAAYASKGADWEMTHSHLKRAAEGGRTITQLLEDIAERREAGDIAIAREYQRATKHRKTFGSWGEMRKRYGKRLSQAVEYVEGDLNETEFTEVCSIDAEVFRAICERGGKPALLAAADVSLVAVKAVLANYGFEAGVYPPGQSAPLVRRKHQQGAGEKEKLK